MLKLASLAVLLTLVACSSDKTSPNSNAAGDAGSDGSTNGGGCAAYKVPAGTDLTQPVVSLKNDVVPIFEQSCSIANSCHKSATVNRVFLGGGTTDSAGLRQRLVDVPSRGVPTMPFVTAGDPTKSWLQLKLDGDFCLFNGQCQGPDAPECGESMPEGSDLLSVEKRDIVRRWIAQGAKDN